MIRSALKTGLKRLLGVEVKPAHAPAPPPAWRDAPAAKVEPPKQVFAVAPAAAPVVEVAPAPKAVTTVPAAAEVGPSPKLPPTGLGAEPPLEREPEVVPPEKKGKAKKGGKPPALAVAVAAKSEAAEPVAEPEPVGDAAPVDEVGPPAFSMEQVQELFDEMVRPALQGDGGDIALLRIERNDVYVRLVGSCSSCPSSVMTMKLGVEALLKEELPGFGNLIQVD